MPIVLIVFGLAAAVWGAILARHVCLALGVGSLVVVAYVFGHEFWSERIGPLPLTLDRILLIGLFAAAVAQWRCGGFHIRRVTGSDLILAALLLVLGISAAFSGDADVLPGATSKWGRLIASFLVPAGVYFLMRQLPLSSRDWTGLLVAMVVLGVYLAGTAACEYVGAWSMVFPRYVADPNLGIHFGRARGPELNSVSLGVYLTACAVCAWLLLPYARKRWQQLSLLMLLPLMSFAVVVTYTRSTYIGFAVSAMVIAAFQIPRQWRTTAVGCGLVAGAFVACVAWSQLMGMQREGAAGDAAHSVDQRASFAYVSWQMFRERPILGVGFGRFYDAKLPYLSDRRQQIELESIRGLHHHNTFLSVLTETGMVGLAAFLGVFAAWTRCAWHLASSAKHCWVRAQGILMLALTANYLCSAAFHDLTLLPSQELLLLVMAGLTVNLHQVSCGAGLSAERVRLLYSTACPARTS